jgi:transposase
MSLKKWTIEENKQLREENSYLREIINKLEKRVQEQEKRISELEEELRKTRIGKNSRNSSKPPSSDMSRPKRNRSLRQPSGKRPGGQPGHKGTTLNWIDTPDEIIELTPGYCNKCGCSLENAETRFLGKRQEIDIPPIHALVKEYRINGKTCPNCGHQQSGQYPEGIASKIQYGPNVVSLVAYLSVYQFVPFKRLKEIFRHVFNMEISEGTVDNMLKRMAGKSGSIYQRIKSSISESKQVGTDETSVKVNGKKNWIWTWQTALSTFLTVSESRGSKTIDSEFPYGLVNSILSSDRLAAQLKTPAKAHQLCFAHLLRDLKYLQALEDTQFSYAMEEMLKLAIYLKGEQSFYNKSDCWPLELEEDLDAMLKEDIPKASFPKTFAFRQSLVKHRRCIFTFLYNSETPPDNNASERAIRNVKVKQKVSGQFKSNENVFCILRSVIDTCKKRGIDILFALSNIAQIVPAE